MAVCTVIVTAHSSDNFVYVNPAIPQDTEIDFMADLTVQVLTCQAKL
eukprot:COSAG02_NODE_68_length_42582_cov_52.351129_27_plen_47_part_00